MTARDSSSLDFTENLLLRALVISLLIHLVAFGTWKWGQAHGWWRQMQLPVWMQMVRNSIVPIPVKKISTLQPTATPPPMLFVDVDPNLATVEPPKNPKFYSNASSEAASKEKKPPSDLPQITGTQNKEIKTVADGRSQAKPLQPSPRPTHKTEPKKAEAPGDLAMAKPQDKPVEANPETPPEEARPRTIAEALRRQGKLGAKMRQDGGAPKLALDSSLDVKRTSFGDYDSELIDAIKERWFDLLKDRQATIPGKVVLEFRLHYDGRITDMKMPESEVSELEGLICQQAILDPSPFKPWPSEMRHEIGADYRDIRFTFYYLNE